jgi:hypothetical protein
MMLGNQLSGDLKRTLRHFVAAAFAYTDRGGRRAVRYFAIKDLIKCTESLSAFQVRFLSALQ